MPTPECLDERSKAILKNLDELSDRITLQHQEIRAYIKEREQFIAASLRDIEEDVEDLKLSRAEDRGKKSIILFIGGLALTAISVIFGAIGNIIYQWLTGPHGPIRLD